MNKELHSLQKGLRFFSEFLARIRPIWHRRIIKRQSELSASWQRRQSSSPGKWRMCFSLGMARQWGYQTMVRWSFTFAWRSLRIFSTRYQLPASPEIWAKVMLRVQVMVAHGVKATKRAGLQLFWSIFKVRWLNKIFVHLWVILADSHITFSCQRKETQQKSQDTTSLWSEWWKVKAIEKNLAVKYFKT